MVNRIIEILESELPEEYKSEIDKFKHYTLQKKYRQAYLVLNDLKKIKNWSPSSELLQLMEKYWWEYAN